MAAFHPPSPYYRVSAKALIFDGDRLLVFKDARGEWEIPGGGWEHDESFEECLSRELKEEMGVAVASVGEMRLHWRDYSEWRGVHYVRLAASVTLTSHEFVPSDDDLVEARFVTKQEFLALPFQEGERGVQDCADKIWPPLGGA